MNKNLQITKEQYNRIFGDKKLNETFNSSPIEIKSGVETYMGDNSEVEPETIEFIKLLYGQSETIHKMLDAGIIIKGKDGYKLSKTIGDSKTAMLAVQDILKSDKEEIYQPEMKMQSQKYTVTTINYDGALLKDDVGKLYYLNLDSYTDTINTDYAGSENDISIDSVQNFLNDYADELSLGYGKEGQHEGNDIVLVDADLAKWLISVYDDNFEFKQILSSLDKTHNDKEIDEMSTCSSSGSFVGLMSGPIKRKVLEVNVVAEETNSIGQYDTPGGLTMNLKSPKTNAEEKTQYPNGEFTTPPKCSKLDNNKEAQNGGCNAGPSSLNTKKSKGSIISPSLGENKIYETIAKKTGLTVEAVKKIIESKKSKS